MYDILLVQPRFESLAGNNTHSSNPPLGLSYLAAVLEDKFNVGVLDFNAACLSCQEDAKKIMELQPKVVGISVSTPSLPFVYALFNELKKQGFYGNFLLGGPHITARPETLAYFKGALGLRGEGEERIEEICSYLMGDKGGGRGGLWVDDSLFVHNLEGLPLPAMHLLDMKRYKFIHLMCSRGCPYDCTYCSMAKSRYRQRNPESVVEEMLINASAYPKASLGFGDDVFTLDRDFVVELCRDIRKKDLRVMWSCTTRADLVDGKLLEYMHKAGCWHISFGIESGVEEIRYSLSKRIENSVYIRVFNECRRRGIRTRAYAMFGHLGEKLGDMYETIRFVGDLRPDDVVFSLSSIYPGTALARHALDEGFIEEDVWDSRMLQGLGAPIYIPKGVVFGDIMRVMGDAASRFNLH